MKFVGVLLAIFAVSCVRANPEECTAERGDACVDNLFRAFMHYASDEDVCRELIRSVDCLKEAADNCLGERNSAVDDVFEALDKLLGKCKAIDVEMTKIEKCYEQNKNYIMKCVYGEREQDPNTLILEGEDMDDDKKCEIFDMVVGCFVDRVREKCGDKAASMAEKEVPYISFKDGERCDPIYVIRLSSPFL